MGIPDNHSFSAEYLWDHSEPKTSTAADARDGYLCDLSKAESFQTISCAIYQAISVTKLADKPAESGIGRRHHIYPVRP